MEFDSNCERIGAANVSRASLLAALRLIHRQIEGALAELQAASAQDAPDPKGFAPLRMRVAQALLAKHQLIAKVANYLTATASAEKVATIRNLQEQNQRCSQVVSEVVARWTPKAIQQDLQQYRCASRQLKNGVLCIVAAEKAIVYPLLDGQA